MRDFRKNNESVTINEQIIGHYTINVFVDGILTKTKTFYRLEPVEEVLKMLGYVEVEK